MTKKIRLVDEETTEETRALDGTVATFTAEEKAQVMKYMEAMDWKLWEILKLLRAQTETK